MGEEEHGRTFGELVIQEEDGPASPERLVGADRVLAVLVTLGDHPEGISLDELSVALSSPKPTIHRALVSLRKAGLATQLARGSYAIGDEFIRIAYENVAERSETPVVMPRLERLSEHFGETAHYAVLDGDEVVYRAKTDAPRGAVKLTSVIGGRNPAYCTAVGKLLLSELLDSEEQLVSRIGPGPFPQRTATTICAIPELWRELAKIRRNGFAVDDQENETGVNCVAVPFRSAPGTPMLGAVSVSALAFRVPLPQLVEELSYITSIVDGTALN